MWGELIAGRSDVMITDSVEARLQQKLHPELKLYVDQWLHLWNENGERDKLLSKWLN